MDASTAPQDTLGDANRRRITSKFAAIMIVGIAVLIFTAWRHSVAILIPVTAGLLVLLGVHIAFVLSCSKLIDTLYRTRPQPAPEADSALAAVDSITRVAEFITGYRATLERQGFSPTAAEQMATVAHMAVWQAMIQSNS